MQSRGFVALASLLVCINVADMPAEVDVVLSQICVVCIAMEDMMDGWTPINEWYMPVSTCQGADNGFQTYFFVAFRC